MKINVRRYTILCELELSTPTTYMPEVNYEHV